MDVDVDVNGFFFVVAAQCFPSLASNFSSFYSCTAFPFQSLYLP